MKGRKQATGFQRIRFYVKRDALQRSWVRVLNIFIQNQALLAHIHLHLLGASFTKLKQGPFISERRDSHDTHYTSIEQLLCALEFIRL